MAFYSVHVSQSRYISLWCFIICISINCCNSYEKTLRKIIKNESKMEQIPFSESDNLIWVNNSLKTLYDLQAFNLYPKTKTKFFKRNLPKISTYFKTGETWGNTKKRKVIIEKALDRPARNMPYYQQSNTRNYFFDDNSLGGNGTFEQTSPPSMDLQQIKMKLYDVPYPSDSINEIRKDEENEIRVKEFTPFDPSSFIENLNVHSTSRLDDTETLTDVAATTIVTVKYDEVDHSTGSDEKSSMPNNVTPERFNESTSPGSCTVLTEISVDIDTEQTFNLLDIEPPWIPKKTFWSNTYNKRYSNLMRNSMWPPLKAILVPTSHVDGIWKKTFEQYYNHSAHNILTNIVKKLNFYSNLTFSWNEVAHLSQWWKTTNQKNRVILRRLVKSGRFEITTGGWVEADEATSTLFTLTHLLVEGHQWLKNYLNMRPSVGCLVSSVTHSPTMPYLLSASDIIFLVTTNLHFTWENYLAEYQYSDFIWLQNWDNDIATSTYLNDVLNKIGSEKYPRNAVFTHFLQFNSAGIKGCGPDKDVCLTNFNFATPKQRMDVNHFNVKQKSELLLEQYSKLGTLSPHNVIVAPIGGPYHYETQTEVDYQFVNYEKLVEFINYNSAIYRATAQFGTYRDYFDTVLAKHQTYPTLKGDFLTYADIRDGSPSYWTGYFTTRPMLKILIRRLQSTLRSTEILFAFASNYKVFNGANVTNIISTLIKARKSVARLSSRNVLGGTLSIRVLRHVYDEIIATTNDCWYIQEVATSLLTIKPGMKKQYLQKYIYRDGEFITLFKSVLPGDQIYVFNSLSHERTEIVELISRKPNMRIIDHKKNEIKYQVNPIWKYSNENVLKISKKFYKIIFAVVIPPMTLELFKIKDTYAEYNSVATLYCISCTIDDINGDGAAFPFMVHPIKPGDIQLESYKHRIIFDEMTGFMKTIFDKELNVAKSVVMDYGAFRSSDKSAGMYLFNTNVTKPLHDFLAPYRMGMKTKLILISSGFITTEMTVVYGRTIQHTVKLYNLLDNPLTHVIAVESKLDIDVSPKNRDLEFFLSIETDISNGNPPELYTDNNGYQYSKRVLNVSRRVESNMYPMNNMAYIQDDTTRLTLIADHTHGVTALQEGQILIMLDRRVLYNDGRGVNEGLADSSVTVNRHYMLLENFGTPNGGKISSHKKIELPSLTATYLSNCMNYQFDMFLIQKNLTSLCYYTFLPLIKVPFPCDVSVVNFRVLLKRKIKRNQHPDTALLILHRQMYSCRINSPVFLHCNGNQFLSLKNVFRHVSEFYKTNLVGTNTITRLNALNENNFNPMEIASLQLKFDPVESRKR